MPEGGTSGAELVSFYDDNSGRIIVGASLSLLAIAVFLLAASAFRRVLMDAEGGDVLATTAFAGALLGVGSGIVAESVNMLGAIRAKDGELDEGLARALFEIPQAMGTVATAVGFAVFALATAWVAGRSGRVFPRYDVVLVTLIGLVLLSPARGPAGGRRAPRWSCSPRSSGFSCCGRHAVVPVKASARGYSHSIVPGGFDVTSRVTRLTPRTSLMMRFETRSSRS